MKKILYTLTILLVSAVCFAQPQDIKIDNGQFVYEKIFTIDTLSAGKIDTLLQQYLPTQKGITNLKSINNQITANFTNLFVDHNKYETNAAPTICNAPLSAKINIYIKDGKYKVIVNGITLDATYVAFSLNNQVVNKQVSAEGIFLKNEQTEFRTRGDLEKAMEGIEKQFTEIFTIKTTNNDW